MCCSNLSADFKVKFYSFSRIKRQHNEIHNTRTATKVLHKITASRTIIAHFTVMDNLIYIIIAGRLVSKQGHPQPRFHHNCII